MNRAVLIKTAVYGGFLFPMLCFKQGIMNLICVELRDIKHA